MIINMCMFKNNISVIIIYIYIIRDKMNTHYFDNNIYIDNKLLNRVEFYTFLEMLNLTGNLILIYLQKSIKIYRKLYKLKFS